MPETDETITRQIVENDACTCGAGEGSHEGHTDWCVWLKIVEPMWKALGGCERYADRIANNPDAHSFDRENARGVIRVVALTRAELAKQ